MIIESLQSNQTIPRHVLLADRDLEETERLSLAFARERFTVHSGRSFEEALDAASQFGFAMIVLDLGLVDGCGMDSLRSMRAASPSPLIVIDGEGTEDDMVLGLDLGADDYVQRPCFAREVVARSKAILRRREPSGSSSPAPVTRRVTIDHRSHQVLVDGTATSVTAREFELLDHLASSPGRAFTTEQLMLDVWGSTSRWQSPSTIREHVFRLRQKIEVEPARPRHLITVRGVGYRFEP